MSKLLSLACLIFGLSLVAAVPHGYPTAYPGESGGGGGYQTEFPGFSGGGATVTKAVAVTATPTPVSFIPAKNPRRILML